ncbi:MAG TPA: hypothetical protein ENF75_04415 [Acidilobales archaeon]|nr:hypothetical protein [Acidilobales archaeon]
MPLVKVAEILKGASSLGIDPNVLTYLVGLVREGELSRDLWVYIEGYVPMRLNHVFDELRKKGFKVIEAHVYEGYLILVCDYLR